MLQNAKFDNETQRWEDLESNLHNYGITPIVIIEDNEVTTIINK